MLFIFKRSALFLLDGRCAERGEEDEVVVIDQTMWLAMRRTVLVLSEEESLVEGQAGIGSDVACHGVHSRGSF